MLYSLLRVIVRFLLYVFYSEIVVSGKADHGGPQVLVANHPSTLNDALLIACQFNRRVSIIAKASLFDNPITAWVLRVLGVLPVRRRGYEVKADQSSGAEASSSSNDDTFLAIYECLAAKGVVLIFPEGTSHLEPQLIQLKTGAARMVLGAEERFGPLGVKIIPVGLVYEDPQAFGTAVRIRFGESIPAAPFLEQANGDRRQAARAMTDQIQAQLVNEMVHLENPESQNILMTIHRWIGDRFVDQEHHSLDVLLKIAKVINYFNQHDEKRVQDFRDSIKKYYGLLESQNLSDAALEDPPGIPKTAKILGVLIFPFWLYGAVNHFIPYKIPRLVTKFLNIDPVYDSTVKLATGVFSFSLMYLLQSAVVYGLTNFQIAAWYLASLPVSGMISRQYLQTYYSLKAVRENRRQFKQADPGVVLEAVQIRGLLLQKLSEAERDYFAVNCSENSDQLIQDAVANSLQSGVSGRIAWQPPPTEKSAAENQVSGRG